MRKLLILLSFFASSWITNAALADNPQLEIRTSAGRIVVELYADKAPKTVANFLQYAREGFYNGTIFHRTIDGFMVQGGGFDRDMRQKPTRANIENEANNGLKNTIGTLAMARTPNPHSASAQFFINVKDNDFLNPTPIPPGDPVPRFQYQGRVYENVPRANLMGAPELFGYVTFGKVVSGMETVNKIKALPTGAGGPFPSDVPRTPVIILSASETR